MPATTPQELLTTELMAIRSAEEQISPVLQKHLEMVQTQSLRPMLERRLKEGQRLLQELDKGLQELGGGGASSGGQMRNEAVEGLIRLTERELKEATSAQMHDALLLANLQKIEHYCIAAWGTAKAFARLLGQQTIVNAMERALDEGKRYNDELTELAERELNPAMLQGLKGGAEGAGSLGEERSFGGQSGGALSGEADDLKAREYRDKDGNVHHHTRKYMEEHGGGQ